MAPMPDTVAYKVLAQGEWEVLECDRAFNGAQVDLADGYIHLSTAAQLAETLDKHFAGRDDLMILSVDLDAAGDAIRWEPSRGGQLFPHLYAPLTLDLVLAFGPLEREADGQVKLPVAG
jgi:uncharacterized protein (DUF952 family)